MYYPNGVDASLLGRISTAGVTVAGGLHPAVATRTFRVGHMGVDGIGEIMQTLAAIERGLGKSGEGVRAAQAEWMG
jgi:alanine-glyoxylate transaminase/serine-glyoxylate transaminase/serine-pyruvate transaminase